MAIGHLDAQAMDFCIRAPVREILLAVARDSSPREACGFLLGRSLDRIIIAEQLVLTRNHSVLRGSFAISDVEVRRVARIVAKEQLHVVGIFHSHPSGLVALSAADERALRRSRYPWLIVGSPPNMIAAYLPSGLPLRVTFEHQILA
jgi:proteasome lid subunit RPN8/RPN11